ncbi:MAG TPA: glycosyltransferase family 9 protein [Armatimonadota bacterium]
MNVGLVRFVDRKIGVPLCCAAAFAQKVSPRRWLGRERAAQALTYPRKILMMKWVGFGNLILASPAVAAFREKFPDAEITFVTISANRGLLERYPMVDHVHYFNVTGLRSVVHETLRLLRFMYRERFDMVVDFEQFSRYSALIAGLGNAPVRVGFATAGQGRSGVYSHPVEYRDGVHMADVFCDLARAVGGVPRPEGLAEFSLSDADLLKAEAFLGAEGLLDRPFVVIHPGTGENAPQRRWPAERFAELADQIIQESGMAVVFSGSPREKELVDSVRGRMKSPASSTAGLLNLSAFAAVLQSAQMIVCADTGPVHLAAALQVPAVAFYGPNDPTLYGPVGAQNTVLYRNLPCSPCITNFNDKSTNCPHGECIQGITVEETYLAIQRRPVRRIPGGPSGTGSQRVV